MIYQTLTLIESYLTFQPFVSNWQIPSYPQKSQTWEVHCPLTLCTLSLGHTTSITVKYGGLYQSEVFLVLVYMFCFSKEGKIMLRESVHGCVEISVYEMRVVLE